ncbi:MAG: alkaline phosphatase family protein [Kiritimatiellae bacterium]|nr:alkaline phosphatase family protein [Kiritimatiellia bacterium]
MKHIVVSVAGLGWRDLEQRGLANLAGLDFRPVRSVFPAVTCVAQATLRTALPPRGHGMVANGWFCRETWRPSFWEQSARLVRGERIWSAARGRGDAVGMFFFQQSVGESVDRLVSPAHVHKHGGGSILYRYTLPPEADAALRARNGAFPLHRYWGPLAHPKAGDAVLADFLAMQREYPCDVAFLYLNTLDYDAQRFGPDAPRGDRAFAFFRRELEKLAALAEAEGASLTVLGEYGIGAVTAPPAFPNRALREAGLLRVRPIGGRAYPDPLRSRAFAMCDHEVAHVYVRDPADVPAVRAELEATGAYGRIEERAPDLDWAHETAGELLLVAKAGSWCAYPWWTDRREAPDYATHIDIHNKPGYDPSELFFDRSLWLHPRTCQDHTRIRGTHGRRCDVAVASTLPLAGDSALAVAAVLRAAL